MTDRKPEMGKAQVTFSGNPGWLRPRVELLSKSLLAQVMDARVLQAEIVFAAYGDFEARHVIVRILGGNMKFALEAVRECLYTLTGNNETFMRAEPFALTARDFMKDEYLHKGYARFTVLNREGVRHPRKETDGTEKRSAIAESDSELLARIKKNNRDRQQRLRDRRKKDVAKEKP